MPEDLDLLAPARRRIQHEAAEDLEEAYHHHPGEDRCHQDFDGPVNRRQDDFHGFAGEWVAVSKREDFLDLGKEGELRRNPLLLLGEQERTGAGQPSRPRIGRIDTVGIHAPTERQAGRSSAAVSKASLRKDLR